MSLFSEFKTDKKLEVEGREFVYTAGDGKPVFKVRIARSGGANKKYDQVRERVTAPYRRLQTLTDEMNEQIALEIFAEAIIVKDSWYTFDRKTNEYVPGIETDSGEIVPATPEVIVEVMKALPDLYNILAAQSIQMSNYKAVALEQDSKN